jgi:hypothetical protein
MSETMSRAGDPDAVRRDVLESERPLDDLASARIWLGISQQVLARRGQPPRPRRRWRKAVAVLVALVSLPVAAAVAHKTLGLRIRIEWERPVAPQRREPPHILSPQHRASAPSTAVPQDPLPVAVAPPPPLVPASPADRPRVRPPSRVQAVRRHAVEVALAPSPPQALDTTPPSGPTPLTPAVLYERAENALRRGETARARSDLETLLRRFADSDLGEVALYELTLLALRAGDVESASTHAQALVARARNQALRSRGRMILDEIRTAAAGKGARQ